MKKFLSMAALAVAALSCTEDLEAPQVETPTTGETKTITVEASLSADDQTRVAIDGDGSGYEWDFKWEASDELHYIANVHNINSLSIAKDNDGNFNEKRAEFSGDVPTSGEEYLYYGYTFSDQHYGLTIILSSQDGSISQIPLKSQDKIDFSSIEDGASIPVNMNHMGAFININAQFNGMSGYEINKVVVMGLNSDYVYGPNSHSQDGEMIELYKKSNITITPDSPIAIGGEQITIPFTIFPTEVTEAESITVVFCLTDGSGAEKFIKIVKTPGAGKTFNLESATVNNLGAELSSSELFIFKEAGTESEPFLIQEAEDLRWLSILTNIGYFDDKTIYCTQTADIDLEDEPFSPFNFTGVYDGEKHTISGLNIYGDYEYAGLFKYITNSTIKNLAVKGSVTNTDTDGDGDTGGIVGYANDSNITNCYSDVEVNGNSKTGGIAGFLFNESNISDCYNNGTVNGGSYTGAIAGYLYYKSSSKDNRYLSGTASKAIGKLYNSETSNDTKVDTAISIEEFFATEPVGYTVAEIVAGNPKTDGNASDCTWIITDEMDSADVNFSFIIREDGDYKNI